MQLAWETQDDIRILISQMGFWDIDQDMETIVLVNNW